MNTWVDSIGVQQQQMELVEGALCCTFHATASCTGSLSSSLCACLSSSSICFCSISFASFRTFSCCAVNFSKGFFIEASTFSIFVFLFFFCGSLCGVTRGRGTTGCGTVTRRVRGCSTATRDKGTTGCGTVTRRVRGCSTATRGRGTRGYIYFLTVLLCCSHVLCVCPTFLAGLNKCSHAYLLSAVHNESLPSWDKEGMYNYSTKNSRMQFTLLC